MVNIKSSTHLINGLVLLLITWMLFGCNRKDQGNSVEQFEFKNPIGISAVFWFNALG